MAVEFVVYDGEKSKKVAEYLSKHYKIRIVSEKDSWGIDKFRSLFLFDKKSKKRIGCMVNQSFKNKKPYPFSVAIFRIGLLNVISNQIYSDYLRDFEKNIKKYGYPWGNIRKKDKNRNFFDSIQEHGSGFIKDFAHLLKSTGIIEIGQEKFDNISKWLETSKKIRANVFIMVCPDYAYERESGKGFRYSGENKLNEGIGLVSRKSLEFLQKFSLFMNKNKLKIRIIIGIADYEDTGENLSRLDETKATFHNKITQSLKKVDKEMKNMMKNLNISYKVVLIRESFGNRIWDLEWNESEKAIKKMIAGLNNKTLKNLLKERKKLYLKWYKNIDDKETLERFIKQGTEYTTCGYLFNRSFKNLMIIGTNSINMELFYKIRAKDMPVLYITEVYR